MIGWKSELEREAGNFLQMSEDVGKSGRRILHLKKKTPETAEKKERRLKLEERRATKKKKRARKR